jgi:hypothetical protein
MLLLPLFSLSVLLEGVVKLRGWVLAMDRCFTLQSSPARTPGLKVVDQYDFSRTYRPKIDAEGKPTVGERARPLQTLIWYPAEKSGKKPMTVGDYSELLATETSFDKPKLGGNGSRGSTG